jgi:5-methylcytosine-specific restriction protein B
MSVSLVEHICKSVTAVNKQIVEDMSLGEGFQIGHSYFCAYSSELNEDIWWDEIIKFELKPMLEEIWFDDLTKVSDVLVQLSR